MMTFKRTRPGTGILQVGLLVLLLSASITGFAQLNNSHYRKPVKDISDSLQQQNPASLMAQFGRNKSIPKQYEKQILYALSYFPDLVNTRIKFSVKKSADGIIDTRPTVGSIFRRSSKRTYLVFIHDSSTGRALPAFANADVNGQVGILGHELCHIVYFNNRTGIGLIGLGIGHISKKYIDRFEFATDSANIERGLGYQLMAWKQYLTNRFRAMYTQGRTEIPSVEGRRRYMSVAQIKETMDKSGIYE